MERVDPRASVWDAVIVGGGPAGLSAALILGRARRRVLVIDSGEYRNAVASAMHGFLTRDGEDPADLRRTARKQLDRYRTLAVRNGRVTGAGRRDRGFELKVDHGEAVATRLLLLATGVVDELPVVRGASELYGRGLYHCPYCDGFEVADQPLAAFGRGKEAAALAFELTGWSDEVVLLTNGPSGYNAAQRERLRRNRVAVRERTIDAFAPIGDGWVEIQFADDSRLERAAVFFATTQRQRSPLAEQLGCRFTGDGSVATGSHESTSVPGLFVAGDASRRVQLAIVAAAEGAQAAFAMNTALLRAAVR